MTHVVLARLIRTIPLLFIVSVIVFGLILMVPGDPAASMAGEGATPEAVAAIRESLGLNDPIWQQYLRWVGNLLTGDLGTSLRNGTPVTELIGNRFPVSASLAFLGTLVAVLIGIPVGIYAAVRRGTWIDRVLTIFATMGMALPSFWLGLILISAFAINSGLFPAGGYVSIAESPTEWFKHLFLPALTLGLAGAAEVMRYTRSAMGQVLENDYIRTARAQGLGPLREIVKHGLRNASISIVTVIGFQVVMLFGATVIVEQIFALPGMGSMAVEAVLFKDIPLVQGVVIVAALVVMLVNLVTDLSYIVLNPKVRVA